MSIRVRTPQPRRDADQGDAARRALRSRPAEERAEAAPAAIARPDGEIAFALEALNLWYGAKQALTDVGLEIARRRVTALIGPSGCGKSTLLRCLNRMNDLIPGVSIAGRVSYHGVDIYGSEVDPVEVRRRVGMVFQKPNPFPKSIYENVAFGARVNGFRGNLDDLVERSLRRAALWDEVRDDLRKSGLAIARRRVTALIGPSGCGKSTLLRCLNRMNDLIPGVSIAGRVSYHGVDIYGSEVDPVEVRRRVGMVFQKPNPFPKSIYENVAFGARVNGFRGNLDDLVERSLRRAALWDEVRDDLRKSGLALSGGQQQRLCIARALANNPDVILMDEPCSALDPIATLKIEDLMRELADDYTIVVVTHNMQQAARVSDYTAFMLTDEDITGQLIEYAPTETMFTQPADERTEDYISGRFG